MKESRLDAISTGLEQERELLVQESEGLRRQIQETDGKLKRVQAAIKALSERPIAKKSQRKPSVNKAEVINIIQDLLAAQPVLTAAMVKNEVESRVVQMGRSRMGLALRMKEALADVYFVKTAEGYQLAADHNTS